MYVILKSKINARDFFTLEFLWERYIKDTSIMCLILFILPMTDCLYCPSNLVHKNGKLASWWQRRKCGTCKKQFSTWGARDTYSPEFKKKVVEEYCHSPAWVKIILKKYGISSRTLIKWKKNHKKTCVLCAV